MTWVAFRQYRTELLIAFGILAALTAFLLPTGLDKLSDFRDSGLASCLDAGGNCIELRDRFVDGYNSLNNIVGWFNFVPGIVGVLLAAPLITEFEQRTHRLAWTQSVTRRRWLTTKLAVGIGGAIVFSLGLTALMTWWHHPLDRTITVAGRDFGPSYDFEGLMPFSYTVFAFALALALGAWSRRSLVAMPLALVGFLATRVAVLELLRQGIASDVSFEAPAGELALNEATRDIGLFWQTQAIEAAFFISIAACLIGLAAWLVTRRM